MVHHQRVHTVHLYELTQRRLTESVEVPQGENGDSVIGQCIYNNQHGVCVSLLRGFLIRNSTQPCGTALVTWSYILLMTLL